MLRSTLYANAMQTKRTSQPRSIYFAACSLRSSLKLSSARAACSLACSLPNRGSKRPTCGRQQTIHLKPPRRRGPRTMLSSFHAGSLGCAPTPSQYRARDTSSRMSLKGRPSPSGGARGAGSYVPSTSSGFALRAVLRPLSVGRPGGAGKAERLGGNCGGAYRAGATTMLYCGAWLLPKRARRILTTILGALMGWLAVEERLSFARCACSKIVRLVAVRLVWRVLSYMKSRQA